MICTLDQLKFLIERGLISRKFGSAQPVNFAVDQGMYMGCPGKDIYLSLGTLSKKELEILAVLVSKLFPNSYPVRSVHFSVFIRYMYGCNDKQGCLQSDEMSKKMIEIKPDWTLSHEFVDMIIKILKNSDNQYGLAVFYEMKAHRIGDEIIIFGKELDAQLIELYTLSAEISERCGFRKNAFSAYYWLSEYLYVLNRRELFVYYAKKFFENINRFCWTTSIRTKISNSLLHMYSCMSAADWIEFVSTIDNYNNRVLLKMLPSHDKLISGVI